MILNQTSRNKGCCDLKGPWDHFRVSKKKKKKLHERNEEETRKKESISGRKTEENDGKRKNIVYVRKDRKRRFNSASVYQQTTEA